MIHTCSIANIPIQRWINIIVSCYGRTLDIYLDGKLVRTCVLPGVAKIDSSATVFVTPDGGFSGWTSLLQYWPTSFSPQQAWNVYQTGYGGSSWSQFIGNYSLQISLLQNDQTASSLTI